MKEFNELDFDNEKIACTNCNWKGTGAKAILIDFFGVTPVREVHCPKCDEKLGILHKVAAAPNSPGDELSNQFG